MTSTEPPLDSQPTGNSGDSPTTQFRIEQFAGPNDELQKFIEATWSEAYSGKMSFPVWSKEYFDWQLAPGEQGVDRRLAVYDGDRVVAVLLGTPAEFRSEGVAFHGAHWSWLSVAASHRGCGLATLLDEARVELEQRVNSELIVSYRFVGSKHSLAERPSNRFPLKRFHGRFGFWARPLDGKRLQNWNLDRTEGFLSRIVTPFLPSVRTSRAECIRPYGQADLSDCLKVAGKQFANCSLKIDWNDRSLNHQLAGSPIVQTVVAECDGAVGGFVNFHILPFQGATREPVAIIDMICVGQLPAKLQRALMTHSLGLMREQGAILALKIRTGDVPGLLMLRTGFTPRLPDSSLVLQWTQSVRQISGNAPLHVLWR